MEAHMVHFNEKYGNIETAINKKDGLAVVAFFIQASGHKDCQQFKQITEKLLEIQQPNSKCSLNSSRSSTHIQIEMFPIILFFRLFVLADVSRVEEALLYIFWLIDNASI